jgi:hypothetical protein
VLTASPELPYLPSHLRQRKKGMRLVLLLVVTLAATAAASENRTGANGRGDPGHSRQFTPVPGVRVSQEGCRIPDRCVDARGQWICPCTAEAKACGFCGQSY